jgi:hypothetical protein
LTVLRIHLAEPFVDSVKVCASHWTSYSHHLWNATSNGTVVPIPCLKTMVVGSAPHYQK